MQFVFMQVLFGSNSKGYLFADVYPSSSEEWQLVESIVDVIDVLHNTIGVSRCTKAGKNRFS